jgi:hypothetical protein
MQSVRDRQIREVIDEDMNINRQVFEREKEQVRVFQEDVLPKKTSDVEAEISVDKLIETLNGTLENKLTGLEYLLSKIVGTKDIGDAQGRQSYNNVVNNGDFITPYNQLVRVYTLPGISRASQEAIKVKFQELKPNLDAMVYGLQELIQYLFESGKTDKDIFQLVRSQAVYEFVNKQLYTANSFKIIEQADINVYVKEVLSDLSEVQRAKLKDISGRNILERSLLKLPVEIGDDEERIKQLESELGFNLPRGQLSEYGRKEKEQAMSEFGNIGKDIMVRGRQDFDETLKSLNMQRTTLQDNLKKVSAQFRVEQRDLKQALAEREQLLQGQRNFMADEDLKDNDIERELPISIEINERKQHIESLRKLIANLQQKILDLTEQMRELKGNFESGLKEAQESGIAREISKRNLGLRKKRVLDKEREAEISEVDIPDGDSEQMANDLMVFTEKQLREMASRLKINIPERVAKKRIIEAIVSKFKTKKFEPLRYLRVSGEGNPDTVRRHNTDYKHEPVSGFDDRRNDIYYLQK